MIGLLPRLHDGRGRLQADMDTIEGDRPGPARVGKPEPHLTSPQIGPNDQAKALVTRAGLERWKGEAQIGLRRSVADREGALHRARPARHPFLGDSAKAEEALIAAIHAIIRRKIGRMRSLPISWLPCGSSPGSV